ncbi:hypothetical protein [Nocardia crassostreae]|uniref:hypothetical protein n=1 Tax=Nocardia crassostreae TaxID=53428 RepID=UPI0008349CF7|nr:hypothetical protein [Nocardia crassostreae]
MSDKQFSYAPVLRIDAYGALTERQERHLLEAAPLTDTPETSLAWKIRRSDDLVGIALHYAGEKPSDAEIAHCRRLVRAAVHAAGLEILRVDPPGTVEDLSPLHIPDGDARDWPGDTWNLPYETLDELRFHLDLRSGDPADIQQFRLREFMTLRIWQTAPTTLKQEVQRYLAGLDHD